MGAGICKLLLFLLLALLSGCPGGGGGAPLLGGWADQSGAVTEFRPGGVLVAGDGTESKWSAEVTGFGTGFVTLVYGDISMEFEYSLSGDTLTLTPISIAGETELAPEVSAPTVLTRAKY